MSTGEMLRTHCWHWTGAPKKAYHLCRVSSTKFSRSLVSSHHSNTKRSLRWFTFSCVCPAAELPKSKGLSIRPVSRCLQSCLPTSLRSWSFKVFWTWRLRWVASKLMQITGEPWFLWQIFQLPQVKSSVGLIAWSFATMPKGKMQPL